MVPGVTSITVIHLPDDLRGALAERGMSQNDLSYATGIDAATISRYANGLKPTPRNAANIAQALGLVVDGPVPA
jgi:transcriptional regulator with XRE-family HTH domain